MIPAKAERLETYMGKDYDVDIYSTGGATHWVKITEIDTGRGAVRKFKSRKAAKEFAKLQSEQAA